MARYETTLFVPRPVEATFDFVSDFRNAVKWDPRTYAVEKVGGAPIGVGTTFLLTGGVLPKWGTIGGRLPRMLLRGMPLKYTIVTYDRPRELVLEGATPIVTYDDRITFAAEGSGTSLTYSARLDLRGLLAVGEPVLRLLFKRIGDDATRDIPTAVARGTRAGSS
jgi:hypothetical protein